MMEMNLNTLYFLELIKQYLESRGKNCSAPGFAPLADFGEILRIASYNNCEALIYHTIWKWSPEYGVDAAVIQAYKKRMLFSDVSQLRADAELKEVMAEYNATGIEFLLLKGVIISSLYPDPAYRRSIDADILVSDDFVDQAAAILATRGYENIPNDRIKYEKTYRLEGVLTIELHLRLFEDFYIKNTKAFIALGFESRVYQKQVRVLDTVVKTFTPNHFLIYVICHHAKHFIATGITLRHLIDICLYVNEYYNQLDWEFIMASLEQFRIKDFTIHLLYICQHYLGMVNLSFLYQEIDEDVIGMLIYDIVERNATNSNNALNSMSAREIVRNIYYGSGKPSAIKYSLFPSATVLKKKYIYARKHPVLLPVAWVHRAFSYLLRKLKGQKILSPAERAKIAKERIELLRRVQIL